ncbi:MAPK-interacting and spindle-stabilizing protein-like [Salvia hispanica]|uniref:MAPK-interacting and spindle-stabilizing protein-like n=1 Tax=Salvia hispanica TaxID=49212 RepID=UPI0020094989|nr:MAPK-interacting and spindle-stabilizing protein-like [Salvia hispanica]
MAKINLRSWPEGPDPPDGTPLYAAAQPQFQFTSYQPPSAPYQQEIYPPLEPLYQQPQPTYGPVPYLLSQPHHQNPNTYGYPPAPPQQLQPVRTQLPTRWDPPQAWQPSAWEQPAPYPDQLDRQKPYHQGAPQQQSTSSSIELSSYYAAPRPWQPLQLLPVTAPLFASNGHPQPGVSSTGRKEEDANLPGGEEKLCARKERLIELSRMLKQNEKEKDSADKEVNKNFSKLIEKEIKYEDLKSKLEKKEKDLRVLLEKPGTNEKMEIESLVAIEIIEHGLEVGMKELKTEELVQKECAISNTMKILKKRGLTCAYDPGGNSSSKLLFATLFVVSWFPP